MSDPLSAAKASFEQHLKLADSDKFVVNYALAVAASNFLLDSGDPVWGLIIGPPGSVKTEVLRAYDGHDETFLLDTLTPQSLISGYEREDGQSIDLLPKLDGKIFVLKELTSILGLPQATVAQLTGDLRSVYDGIHSKAFGTVGTKHMKSRFAMLAAVTPIIDKQTLVNVDLGERFVSIRVSKKVGTAPLENGISSRVSLAKHVLSGLREKAEWRIKLQTAAHEAIDYCKANPKYIEYSDTDAETIANLADLVALLRTMPDDEGNPVSPEQPTRTVQQLARLGMGHALVSGRSSLNAEDLALVARVAFDTLPAPVGRLVSSLASSYEINKYEVPITAFTSSAQLSPKWTNDVLRQYAATGVISRKMQGSASTMTIRLEEDFYDKMKACGFI